MPNRNMAQWKNTQRRGNSMASTIFTNVALRVTSLELRQEDCEKNKTISTYHYN